ncbi:DUF1326 domain-containing protein [Nocardioides sp. NPDC051685]|uniref:DUF1326 domain-containing protein n=1 Tax=Nocardioides sp. NPDC051685 TaxID=3364334 RepID=UPI00379AE97C
MAWRIKAKYYEACNCELGCSCNLSGFPTYGKCEGVVAFSITEGEKDGVDLAGAKVVGGAKWPGAIHEGNGALALFIDGTEEQQQALVPILTAEDPGLPWEILASTFTDIHGPFFEPIEITETDGNPRVRVGEKVEVAWQAFANPVTGERHEPHMVLKDGFIFQDGLIGTTSTLRVDADGVTMEHPNKNSYLAEVEWSSENRLAPAEGAGRF